MVSVVLSKPLLEFKNHSLSIDMLPDTAEIAADLHLSKVTDNKTRS